MKVNIVLFVLGAFALAACIHTPDFDTIPRISYNSIDSETELDVNGKKVQENITISIEFEDGDGDLGVTEAEINDYDNFRPAYGNWGNYELVTSRLENNQWVDRILAPDSVKFFPLLKKDGKKGPIKGKLDLHSSAKYSNSSVPVTIKYKVRIRDRALRVSNQIETDTICVPGFL
jgi:hypothetical protein